MQVSRPLDVTHLLRRAREGDLSARTELWDGLYRELRSNAARAMGGRATLASSLQPTALVHEVWLRLERGDAHDCTGREHFLATASRIMRQVLIDALRARRAGKRDGNRVTLELESLAEELEERAIDLEALDQALKTLAQMDPEAAHMVELRFSGGATMEEVARIQGTSGRTLERRWSATRAWLAAQLSGQADCRTRA